MNKEAQRRAAGDRSGRKYSEKYVFYEQKYAFWPIKTRFDPFKGTPKLIFFIIFFQTKDYLIFWGEG